MENEIEFKRKQNLCRFIASYGDKYKNFDDYNKVMLRKILGEKKAHNNISESSCELA